MQDEKKKQTVREVREKGKDRGCGHIARQQDRKENG